MYKLILSVMTNFKNEDNKLTIEEQLELQKLRMKAKFGSLCESQNNMNAKAELAWLQHIEKFEDAINGNCKVSVKEVLGELKIKPFAEIPKEKLENELDELLNKMASKGIDLSILAETPASDIYNFITNELLDYEMDDMRGTGYTTHFTYEDFHPNDKYDIERTIENWITGLCSIEFYEHIEIELFDEVETLEGHKLTRKEMMNSIRPFGEYYENIKIKEQAEGYFTINDEKTDAVFKAFISYTVSTRESKDIHRFEGNSSFELKRDDLGYWGICKFSIPGLSQGTDLWSLR